MQPTRLVSLTKSTPDYIKETYGGKAAGLVLLHKTLPAYYYGASLTYFLPCDASKTRPEVDLMDISKHWKYAVRSGAPVSMPGLMETKLNVAWDDLPAAIEAVWDSYNAPHAQQYREMKNLPDTGTGVVIMPMINAELAGVAFTSPLNGSDPELFELTAEYVHGLGDKLVSGHEATPLTSYVNSHLYSRLYDCAWRLHHDFGASDIEWVWTGTSLYFVQWRAQKFTKATNAQSVEHTIVGNKKILLTGDPIGSKVVIRCKGSEVLYVPNFDPQYYDKMLTTSAIITGTGGTTCHAAIVARERNIPAIRCKMSYAQRDVLHDLETVYVDGNTGEVFTLVDESESIEVSTVKSGSIKHTPVPPDVPQLAKKHYNIDAMLYTFYASMDKPNKLEVHRTIAHVLSSYLLAICIGEGRHFGTQTDRLRDENDWVKIFAQLGITYYDDDRLSRNSQIARIPVMTVERTIETLARLAELFSTDGWSHSFGGHKWEEITRLVLDYFMGKLSDTLFVDACWNKRHNGNLCFDKMDTIHMTEELSKMLDYKREHPVEDFLSEYSKLRDVPMITDTWDDMPASSGLCGDPTCKTCYPDSNDTPSIPDLDKYLIRRPIDWRQGVSR